MEPRPSRRATPPSPDATAPATSGGYPPYDPYTAPEAQAVDGAYPAPGMDPNATTVYQQPGSAPQPGFGVPAGGPPGAQGTTRLGPLADEPVFYPNPGLPPNRPTYDPNRMEPRPADYALHPVGRVPPDHTPLNLRPAPPPVPQQPVPADRGNLLRGILAGAIGLVAVAALVLAFLAFANGGFGLFDDDPTPAPTEPAIVAGDVSAPAAASAPAGTDGTTSPDPDGSAAGEGVIPPAASTAPESSDPAPSEAGGTDGEQSAAASTPPGDEGEGAQSAEPEASDEEVTAQGDTDASPSASARESADSSPSPEPEGGEVAETIDAFLPPADDLPAGFETPTSEGERSLDEVAATFVGVDEDAAEAQANLEEWGWEDNQFITYDAAPQPANEDINRYAVSVHQFETADGASEALPAFVEAFGIAPIELAADQQVGDEVVAMQTTNDDGNLAVLYVRAGQYILKIDAASITGDPLPAALELAEQLVGPGEGGGDESTTDGTTDESGTEPEATEPPAV